MGAVTSYHYDVLNRLVEKQFGSSTYQYSYDATTHTNGIGRLTHASNNINAAEDYYYDAMGRVTSEPFCIPSDCSYSKSVAAQYDLAGNLTQLTYPDGKIFQIARDALGRAVTATYSNASPSPYLIASLTSYAPPGELWSASLGNGLTETRAYNNRQQMTALEYENGTSPVLSQSFTWTDGSGHDNGTLYAHIANLSSGNTMNCPYDTLNRVASATQQSGAYAQTFTYDSFGNLTQAGSFIFSQGYDATNRIHGWSYDANGNLLADQSTGCDLSYDGAGQLTAASSCTSASYVYSAEGYRVRSEIGSNWTENVYLGGQLVAQKNQAGVWTDYFKVDGKLVARTNGTGYIYYETDNLGSVVQTRNGSAGSAVNWLYSPFGADLDSSGTSEPLTFTGQLTDYESGLQYFGARYYSYRMGRFMSPDSLGGHRGNPQSLNKYAYVMNNPLRFTDPTGHDLQEVCTKTKTNGSTCGKSHWWNRERHVGTTDAKGHFHVTHFQTDANGNLAGHDINFNTSGIHIDGNKGEFIAGTDPTRINGESGTPWAGTHFVANSDCGGTCEAGGALFGNFDLKSGLGPDVTLSILANQNLVGPNKGLDAFGDHPGAQFRGGNMQGPDMHLSLIPGSWVDPMHFDNRYPYGSVSGYIDHAAGWLNPAGHIETPLPEDVEP
jgi:RHS repeat-associated protein